MRLALTDFNKKGHFIGIACGYNRAKFKKKFTKENARNLAFIFLRDVTKIGKTRVASRVGIHFGARSCDAMYRVRESKSKLELF